MVSTVSADDLVPSGAAIPAGRVMIKCRLHIDGLVQDCSNSSALALELLQSCTKPSIYSGTWWVKPFLAKSLYHTWNIFTHWLRPCQNPDRRWALVPLTASRRSAVCRHASRSVDRQWWTSQQSQFTLRGPGSIMKLNSHLITKPHCQSLV